MKYGEIRSGPRSRSVFAWSTIPIRPPIAEPKTIPTRIGSKPFRPESASASFAAPSASRTLRSKRRSSLGPARPVGSKSLTSAAIRTGRPSASNARIQSIPLCPATAASPGRARVVPDRRDRPEPSYRYAPHGESLERGPVPVALRPCRRKLFRSRRWRPSSSTSSRPATGSTSPSGTGSAACSRTTAAGCALWSRNGRPLLRYFPELEEVGKLLPPDSALDGEIVISTKGQLDFDSMQMRLHPAESRIRKLSAEIPAQFIAFDILLWKGEAIHELPLEKRRKELERKAKRFTLSPYSRD